MIALVYSEREFVAYGPSYWVVIAVFVIGAVLLVWLGRQQTEAQARRFGRILGATMLAIICIALVYKLIDPSMDTSIPLQLCDLAELISVYALWSQRHWAFTLSYYWGLVLSSQALITPDVGAPDFPGHGFLTFFSLHVLVVWAAIYLTWGRRMRPDWRSYRFAVIVTLIWAVFTLTFNAITGTNYGYLNRKPPTASLLDVLGPWPLYLLIEITVVLIVWALMTWPWVRMSRRADKDHQVA